jgi:hypothetical protein
MTFNTNKWRISSFNGVLLAAYFIPTWTIIACRMMVSPIQSFYERPNVSAAFFIGDYLQLATAGTVRAAWLLALGRLTVAAFFAIFIVLVCRPKVRKSGGCDEALAIALAIGSAISFALMLMASAVDETQALRLHATELLMMLATAIVLVLEGPARVQSEPGTAAQTSAPGEQQLLNDG